MTIKPGDTMPWGPAEFFDADDLHRGIEEVRQINEAARVAEIEKAEARRACVREAARRRQSMAGLSGVEISKRARERRRNVHALRVEGLTFREIGEKMGFCGSRARQLFMQAAREKRARER